MEEKTHWKKMFNYEYLGAYSIDGPDLILTIKSIVSEEVTGNNNKKSDCTVCYFAENCKPMVLNRTNCKMIEKIYKTPYKEDWIGKKIQIYVVNGVKAFGTVTDALRIRPKIPTTLLLELTATHPAWNNVVKYLTNGGDIEKVKTKYKVTKQTEESLIIIAESKKGESDGN